MTLYWAIAVGINQYQHFQPLIYAARDAQALQNCLVGEVGFAAAQTVVLTDTSFDGQPGATAPDRYTIQSAVAQVCQQVQPGDVLWFFFSGYGVQSQGRDYLMPIDGDPAQVATTGIAVESLFSILQSARTDNVLVMLDINRSQGIMAGLGVGAETTKLAQEYDMATILSCPPEQFSHETLALRLGLFTTAVLEGLRNQRCVTLEHLGQFLRDRLPELTEHHWRPRQDPVIVIPDSSRYQLIVPGKLTVPTRAIASNSSPSQNPNLLGGNRSGGSNSNEAAGWPESSQTTSVPLPGSDQPLQRNGEAITSPLSPQATLPAFPTTIGAAPVSAASTSPSIQPPVPTADAVDERSWRRLLQMGGAVLAVLLAAVVVRNVDIVTRAPAPPENIAQSSSPSGAIPIASPNPTTLPATDGVPVPSPQATVGEVPPVPVDLTAGPITAPVEAPGGSPTSPDPGFNPAISSLIVPTPSTDGTVENPAVSPSNPPLDQPPEPAPTAINSPNPTNPIAIFFSNLFNSNSPSPSNSTSPQSSSQPAEPAAIPNPGADGEILNAARAALSQSRGESASNQVTEIAEAIRMARQIGPGQPAYPQAQADIDRWSAMILDMARGRAAQRNGGDSLLAARNYTQAIAAARLVPDDRPQLFTAAQQNIADWSMKMLELANINAGLNDMYLAIQVAQQIPQGTAAYIQAQQAIALWQTQLSQAVGLGNAGESFNSPT